MQSVPTLDLQRVLAQALVRRRRPELDADVEVLGQFVGGLPGRPLSRTGEQQRGIGAVPFGCGRPAVEAAHDRRTDRRRVTFGHRRHRVVLVVEGDVVEDVGVFAAAAVHAVQALLHDRGDLEGECRVVRLAWRNGRGVHQRMTVLVLQAFAHQRCSSGGGAEHEAAGAGVGGLPDEITDALETEHRIERVERHDRDAAGGVCRAGGDEAGRRPGLGDALFEDLAVGGLGVSEQHLVIDRLVLLTLRGVDLELAEQ